MKYHYKPPAITIPVYGELIGLEHPVYTCGTLFREGERGIVVVQKIFNEELKMCYWSGVDPAVANDIYTAPKFYDFFKQHAKEKDYPIFQLRSLMWQLRMKPLKKESWEEYF